MTQPWLNLGIPEVIAAQLVAYGFAEPTPIQTAAIPAVIKDGQDVLGAAETGSGKTLAFAIPLIHYVLNWKDNQSDPRLLGLVLTPTRELAKQIENHINQVGKPLGVKTCSIVGGLSIHKQERIIGKVKPDIIVATPGRFFEFIQNGSCSHVTVDNIHNLPYLVIDEADRLTEKGHFQDLTKIVDALNNISTNQEADGTDDNVDFDKLVDVEVICGNEEENDDAQDNNDSNHDDLPNSNDQVINRRTLVFSATLTFCHEDMNKTNKEKKTFSNKKSNSRDMSSRKISQLVSFLGLDISKCKMIDLTTKGIGRPGDQRLSEFSVTCKKEDKDLFLLYIIKSWKKSIVFCNSKDCLRRLVNVLKLLRVNTFALHADLDQKRRLKAIESFTASTNGVLVASDVAARGLDVIDVDVVVHYQVPRTTETYIHRSGRTARGLKTGQTVILIDPSEAHLYVKLCRSVNDGIPFDILSVSESVLKPLVDMVSIARQVDILEHKVKKCNNDANWFERMAREADIDIEDRHDLIPDKDADSSLFNDDQIKLRQLKRWLDDVMGGSLKSAKKRRRKDGPEDKMTGDARKTGSKGIRSSSKKRTKRRNW